MPFFWKHSIVISIIKDLKCKYNFVPFFFLYRCQIPNLSLSRRLCITYIVFNMFLTVGVTILNIYYLYFLKMDNTTKVILSLGLCFPQYGVFISNVQYQTGLIFGSSRFRHVNNILSQLLPESVSSGHTVLHNPGQKSLYHSDNKHIVAFMINEIVPQKMQKPDDGFSWTKLTNMLNKTLGGFLSLIFLNTLFFSFRCI